MACDARGVAYLASSFSRAPRRALAVIVAVNVCGVETSAASTEPSTKRALFFAVARLTQKRYRPESGARNDARKPSVSPESVCLGYAHAMTTRERVLLYIAILMALLLAMFVFIIPPGGFVS